MNTALTFEPASAPTLPLSPAADNDAPANGCEPGPRLVRFGPRSLYALLGASEGAPRRPRIRHGEGDHGALVSDCDVDLLATAELVFRRQWAAEVGLDPRTADLDTLSPVFPLEELEGDTSL